MNRKGAGRRFFQYEERAQERAAAALLRLREAEEKETEAGELRQKKLDEARSLAVMEVASETERIRAELMNPENVNAKENEATDGTLTENKNAETESDFDAPKADEVLQSDDNATEENRVRVPLETENESGIIILDGIKHRQETGSLEHDSQIQQFVEDLNAGRIQTKISPQKQARHMYGSAEYKRYMEQRAVKGEKPSYIREDLDVQQLDAVVRGKWERAQLSSIKITQCKNSWIVMRLLVITMINT